MDLGADENGGAVSASPFRLALDAFTTALNGLVKAADDGSANNVDRVELVDYLHAFEQSRNRLSLIDHALIHAAEQQDLAQQLCQGSTRQLLAATLRISKGEAARRVRAAEAVGPRVSQLGQPLDPVRPHLAAGAAGRDHQPGARFHRRAGDPQGGPARVQPGRHRPR